MTPASDPHNVSLWTWLACPTTWTWTQRLAMLTLACIAGVLLAGALAQRGDPTMLWTAAGLVFALAALASLAALILMAIFQRKKSHV